MVVRKMVPKDVHALIPRIYEYVTLHGKRDNIALNKAKNFEIDYLGLSVEPNVIT